MHTNINPNEKAIFHRRSIRLKNYNYSRAGAYFITICVQNRKYLFGDVVNEKMMLNESGKIIQSVWDDIPKYYAGIEIDTFQIMPNHIHGVLVFIGEPQLSLPEVIQRFKSLTTRKYIHGVKNNHWRAFDGKLWQRNYYEHVIRDEESFNMAREYIMSNPMNWHLDKMNALNLVEK